MSQGATLTIHTDGAARNNPGPAAFAYVIQQDGHEPIEVAGCLGSLTNNQAEYTALIRALEHALQLGAHHRLLINSDSELVVKQIHGKYKVRDAGLRKLYERVQELWGRFDTPPVIQHVRREENKRADILCNEALDGLR